MEFEKKDDLLAFLNSVVWALRTFQAEGSLPTEKELTTKFPQVPSGSTLAAISSYTGTLNKEELKGKVEKTFSEIEALRDTLLDPTNSLYGIKRIPKEILALPQFTKRKKEEVNDALEASLERLLRIEGKEEIFEEERDFPLFTFTSRSSVSPLYDEAADIFFKEGLVDRDGVARDDYRIKLADAKFKKKLEGDLARVISERHIAEQIASEIDLFFEEQGLDIEELDLGKRLIAQEAAEKTGYEAEKLAGLKRALSKSEEKEKEKMATFFADLLLANEQISNEERGGVAQRAAQACFLALFSFELTVKYEVQVDPETPSFTLITTDLETKKKSSEDFVVAPREVSDFERAYDAEKRDFEILFAAQMAKV